MDFNNFFQSKTFKIIFVAIGGAIVSLLIFQAGAFMGFKKANFSYRWAENYHQNFGGPRQGFFEDFKGRDFIDAHGVFGQIIKIDDLTVVIKGRDDVEKIVSVKDNTVIERFRDAIKITDLKIDDYIIVIGEPNDVGQIEAKFIRLMPIPSKETSFKPLPPHLGWH